MSAKARTAIIAVVLLLVVGVLAKPYIPFLNKGTQEFTATTQPAQVYENALAEKQPIFLEFYGAR
ncbi:hypothetical protein GGQ84_000193 [Desulfitispora alkaliphila]|uniref:hypothetical protein n=1 Tax=Desulfitispora alkaliphila TaxID=622674 RepID=UPI003D1BD41E